jgi:hypothetical protein
MGLVFLFLFLITACSHHNICKTVILSKSEGSRGCCEFERSVQAFSRNGIERIPRIGIVKGAFSGSFDSAPVICKRDKLPWRSAQDDSANTSPHD